MQDKESLLHEESLLTYYGGECKALSGGKIEGFGVIFSSADDPDLHGEFFSRETDFDLEDRTSVRVLYGHGLHPAIGPRQLARAAFELREKGIFFKASLDLGDPFQQTMWDQAQKGALGFSTGSAGHVVVRAVTASKPRYWPALNKTLPVREIKSWPLTELSLTPTPVEPRARAIALKSLMPEAFRLPDDLLQERVAAVKAEFDALQQKINTSLAGTLKNEIASKSNAYLQARAERAKQEFYNLQAKLAFNQLQRLIQQNGIPVRKV